jgi:hypothetical protein
MYLLPVILQVVVMEPLLSESKKKNNELIKLG